MDGAIFPIMSLPEEVRGQTYNFIVQEEAMECRRVCRQWQEEIHTFYNYHLELDDENPHLQKVLDRQRITDCTTGQFLLAPPNRTRIFKNANLIQSVNISKDSISPENLHALLTECAKSLKRLEIHLTKPLLRFQYAQNHFNFPNLRSLEVHSYQEYDEVLPTPDLLIDAHQEVLMINRLVRDSIKPKLAKLCIHLDYHNPFQVDWYSSTVLSTVANHSNTLRWISWKCTVYQQDSGESTLRLNVPFPTYQLGQKDWARIRNLGSLNYLGICNDYNDYDGLGIVDLGALAELPMNLKKLERIDIEVKKFEWMFLQGICGNCFDSLVSIEVGFTDCTLKQFDASCLKDCKNLKELCLVKRNSSELGMDDSYSICNFHLLPESIEMLQIISIRILTTELGLISSSGFKKVDKLHLFHCGDSGLYGVDGEVFQKMILLPKLCQFIVTDLRFSGPDEEADFIGFRDSLSNRENTPEPRRDTISVIRDSPAVPFQRDW